MTWPRPIFPRVVPLLVVGLGSLALAWRLLGDLVSSDEKDAITRALPYNPTTEMDLALWALAQRRAVRPGRGGGAPRAARRPSWRTRTGPATLPPPLQADLAGFLSAYGHRGVAEIDLGLPRWSDDPDHSWGYWPTTWPTPTGARATSSSATPPAQADSDGA